MWKTTESPKFRILRCTLRNHDCVCFHGAFSPIRMNIRIFAPDLIVCTGIYINTVCQKLRRAIICTWSWRLAYMYVPYQASFIEGNEVWQLWNSGAHTIHIHLKEILVPQLRGRGYTGAQGVGAPTPRLLQFYPPHSPDSGALCDAGKPTTTSCYIRPC